MLTPHKYTRVPSLKLKDDDVREGGGSGGSGACSLPSRGQLAAAVLLARRLRGPYLAAALVLTACIAFGVACAVAAVASAFSSPSSSSLPVWPPSWSPSLATLSTPQLGPKEVLMAATTSTEGLTLACSSQRWHACASFLSSRRLQLPAGLRPALAALPPNAKIVDVGGGIGTLAVAAAALQGRDVLLVEPQPAMLSFAAANAGWAGLKVLPFPPAWEEAAVPHPTVRAGGASSPPQLSATRGSVTLMSAALVARAGLGQTGSLIVPGADATAAALGGGGGEGGEADGTTTLPVPLATLDDVYDAIRASEVAAGIGSSGGVLTALGLLPSPPSPPPLALVLDTGGGEYHALRGGEALLTSGRVASIFITTSPAALAAQGVPDGLLSLITFLEARGFEVTDGYGPFARVVHRDDYAAYAAAVSGAAGGADRPRHLTAVPQTAVPADAPLLDVASL